MSGLIVKNLQQFKADLDSADKARVKAAQLSVKVEGHRLMKLLKDQIEAGAPGGKSFSPLSAIAIARQRGNNKTPLHRMAKPVRYSVDVSDKGMSFRFGYLVDDIQKVWDRKTKTGIKSKNRISKRWAYLVKLHQAGGKLPVTDDMRKGLIAIGKRIKKGKQRNVFFLRKETTEINIPARPIIEPFWQANERAAEQNIIANFARKMRGERI